MADLSHFSFDSLTRFDILALVILGMSTLWGLTRGLATELSGIMAWLAAIFFGLRFHGALEPLLAPYIAEVWLLKTVSGAVVFIALLLVFTTLAGRIGALARDSLLGGVDRILGALFGLVRGYFVLVVLYLLMVCFFGSWTFYVLKGSALAPYIVSGATHIMEYLPQNLQPHLAPPATSGHDATL